MLGKTLKLAAPARTADDNVTASTVELANSNPPQQTRCNQIVPSYNHTVLMTTQRYEQWINRRAIPGSRTGHALSQGTNTHWLTAHRIPRSPRSASERVTTLLPCRTSPLHSPARPSPTTDPARPAVKIAQQKVNGKGFFTPVLGDIAYCLRVILTYRPITPDTPSAPNGWVWFWCFV